MDDSKLFRLELRTVPTLHFACTIPSSEGRPEQTYVFPLDRVTGQALCIALEAQPEIAGDLDPSLVESIQQTAQEYAQRDTEFLKQAGIAGN